MKRPASALNIIDRLHQTEGIQKKNSHKGDGGGEKKKNPNTGNGDDKHKKNSGHRGSEQKKNADNGGVGNQQKKNSDKGEGGDEQKNNPDKDGGGDQQKNNPEKVGGGGEQKNNPDNSGGGHGQKKNQNNKNGHGANKVDKAGSQSQPKEDKEKKQQPEETKPTMSSVLGSAPREVSKQEETAVLLRIRLHCDGCTQRITQRILKIKGVKDVVVEDIASDLVKVVGTMDITSMVAYLSSKLNRNVETVGPDKKGDEKEKGSSDNADSEKMQKDEAAAVGNVHTDKGKGIEVAVASIAPGTKDDKKDKDGSGDREKKQKEKAAAGKGIGIDRTSMASAPAPVAPSYGSVAYPQPHAPVSSYYNYYGGNANGVEFANAGRYYHQPSAGTGSSYQNPNPQPNQPYPPYGFISCDENPNACNIM